MRHTFIVALLVTVCTVRTARAQCNAGPEAPSILEWANATAASADSQYVHYRTHLRIPRATASQVELVTDTRICQKVLNAFALEAGVSATGRSVYVVKVADVFVVSDPTLPVGEGWFTSMVLDRRYNVLSKFHL